jgi:hypothetical protein
VEKPDEKKPLSRPWRKGRLILKWIFKKWDGNMQCIDVVQDRNRRAFVNAVTDFRVA